MKSVWEWVFPPRCVMCGFEAKNGLCRACEVGVWEEEQICPHCARTSHFGERHRSCKGPLAGVVCLWSYEGGIRKVIFQAKYRFYYAYLTQLWVWGRIRLYQEDLDEFRKFCSTHPVCVPVPLSSSRFRWRGFNQAEKLAELVAQEWGLTTENLLQRVHYSGSQTGRGRRQRIEAVKNSFRVRKSDSYPSSVVLVDDVWTTGATMRECAWELRKAGITRIWGLVLAR